MKRIKSNHITVINNQYIIALGNGYRISFTNKQAAEKFLSATAKQTTLWSVQVNELHVVLYADYRRCLFYTDKNSRWNTWIEPLHKNFAAVEHLLEYAYRTASGLNGNYFPFINLRNCCDQLITAAVCLKSFYAQKSATVDIYRLQGIIDQCNNLKQSIATYGSDKATEFKTIYKNISNEQNQSKRNEA